MTTFRPALLLFVWLTLLCGVAYPALVTAVAQGVFPHQANGSLLTTNGSAVGSELIGQPFSSPRYFSGRPSALTPFPYNAATSGGSNLSPTNPALVEAVTGRVRSLRGDGADLSAVPVDLVTSSASGLDPHISVAAAVYQIPRVARSRGAKESDIAVLVQRHTTPRRFGVLGESVVNVLNLNLALDRIETKRE